MTACKCLEDSICASYLRREFHSHSEFFVGLGEVATARPNEVSWENVRKITL